jgi:two-component system NtrC family sensor kinase
MRNIAIKHKLISIIMATCLAVLLLASVIQLLFERGEYREETIDSISCYAEMIGENCRAALAFEDAEDATETLKSLQAESSIVFACVYTKEAKVLAYYQQPNLTDELTPPVCKKDGYEFENDYFKLFKQIKDNDETIGTVYIQFDLSQIKSMLLLKAGTVTLIVLACSLVAYLVSSRLQRVISRPILSLADVARAVSEKKDYSARALKKNNDEIGSLIDAFNEMLEQIQQRDSALIDAKNQLESRVKDRTAELTFANEELTREVTERKRAETELKAAQEKLIVTAHRAGMAEVAADVLHNVGNVLNSINVSTTVITDKVKDSEVANLNKVANIINDHIDDIGTFFTENAQGKHIPVFLTEVSKLLIDEQGETLGRLRVLSDNIQHIKDIISMQQSYAKVSSVEVTTSISGLVEDAIQINSAGLQRHGTRLVRKFEELPDIEVNKQKVLQILVNLISNAKYALSNSEKEEKIVTVRIYKHREDRFRIEVTDNGVGITRENLTKIFSHGFTTKKHGHGFGLHSSALASKELGGALTAHSDGLGQGAKFTLELPFKPAEITK